MRGLVGDDISCGVEQAAFLHEACLDANTAGTEHWRQDHINFSQVAAAS
jgi:hypothetical protein